MGSKCEGTYVEHCIREVGNDKIASLSYLPAGWAMGMIALAMLAMIEMIEMMAIMAIMARMSMVITMAMMANSLGNIYLMDALAGTAAIATLGRFAARSRRRRVRIKLDELLAEPCPLSLANPTLSLANPTPSLANPTPPSLAPPPPSSESSISACCQLELDSAPGVTSLNEERCLAKAKQVCEMCETQNPPKLSLSSGVTRPELGTPATRRLDSSHFAHSILGQIWIQQLRVA